MRKRIWAEYEDALLHELYPTIGCRQTSIQTGLPLHHVRNRAKYLKLESRIGRNGGNWSNADIILLKEKFPICDREELEILFNRPSRCIYKKASNLGFVKDKGFVSEISVKHHMRRSYRYRGLSLSIADNPNLVKMHKAHILLTRKIKEYDRVG